MAWDVPRAVFTSALVLVAGPAVLFALRRTQRKAAFLTPIEFTQHRKARDLFATAREMEQTEV